MPPIINREKCISCGLCAQICPLDVLKLEVHADGSKELVVKYPDECWHCRACERDCTAHAIQMRYPLSHMLLYMEPKGGK